MVAIRRMWSRMRGHGHATLDVNVNPNESREWRIGGIPTKEATCPEARSRLASDRSLKVCYDWTPVILTGASDIDLDSPSDIALMSKIPIPTIVDKERILQDQG